MSEQDHPIDEKRQTAIVEKYLEAEKKAWSKFQSEPKLLILGTSDSGKSTLIKQLKIMHGGGFSKEELNGCAAAIRKHVRNTSKVTMMYMFEKNIEIPSECEKILDDIRSMTSTDELLASSTGSSESLSLDAHKLKFIVDRLWSRDEAPALLKVFWNSQKVKEAFQNLPDDALPQTNAFFVEHHERIFEEDYIPTNEDVLKLRTVTQNISKTEFNINGNVIHFYDVSGLKHHRKYWVPYFDNVSSILFVVDISAYDQMMAEDKNTNRLMDSLVLFDQTANNPLLASCGLILFLNKRDIFDKKAKIKSIKDAFPEYNGKPLSVSQSADFVKKRFQATTTKKVIVHYTCATNTDLMQKLLADVIFHITSESLKVAGI